MFTIILVTDINNGIASSNGELPWKNTPAGKQDIKMFRDLTLNNTVIMGKNTFESIGRVLPNRINIIVSSTMSTNNEYYVRHTFDDALELARSLSNNKIFCIGGKRLFDEAINHPCVERIVWNKINTNYDCPAKYTINFNLPNNLEIQIFEHMTSNIYSYKNKQEGKYLKLLAKIIQEPLRLNRTNTMTRSLFGETLRFKLWDERGAILPLLTTKKMAIKAIYFELIWFLMGSTNIDFLSKNNVHIWDGNSTRDFLDKHKHYDKQPGELGPIYGYQWRKTNNIDQLQNAIDLIKNDPFSRRIIVSSWNVSELSDMVLPPCHYSFQFYVSNDMTKLSLLVNMRSADVALGVPFNITSYAFLLHMVCLVTKKTAHELIFSMADCHIYDAHVPAVMTQISRSPYRFPTIKYLRNNVDNIDHFINTSLSDWEIKYKSHDAIKMDMIV